MDNKKLGLTFFIISIIFFGFLYYFNINITKDYVELGCMPTTGECKQINSFLNVTNIGFGFFGFMLGLSVYIMLFSRSDEILIKRLEEEKDRKIEENKFYLIMKALDEHERKVMKSVQEQDGITQNTLRLRTGMSKAKLSYVLQELEKRNLIKRISKGKTLEIWLRV
jgi:uncharacterized membrane protein